MNERLTTSEAAKILGVSTRTVHTYVKSGKLTPMKDEAGRNLFTRMAVMSLKGMKEGGEALSSPMNETPPEASKHEAEAMNPTSVISFTFDPKSQIIIDIQRYEGLLVRLSQLEAEKRGMEEKVKLLEDKRPWWRRLLGR